MIKNLENNGIDYQPQLVNAGFLPSTVGSTAVSIFGKKPHLFSKRQKETQRDSERSEAALFEEDSFFLPDESRDVELGGDFCKKDLQTKS